MTHFIEQIEINGFRAFSNFRAERFGKVNLITGKNNSGKSSLLEAIRILATGGSFQTIRNILQYREEIRENLEDKSYLTAFCGLFNEFPDLSLIQKNFSISAKSNLSPSISKINVGVNWFIRKRDEDTPGYTYESVSMDLFSDTADVIPALEIESSGRKRIIPLNDIDRYNRISPAIMRVESEISLVPCIYVDPFSSRSTHQMGALWDAIALTDSEQEIVKALKLISEDIQAVSLIGGDDRNGRTRTVIAKSSRFKLPVALRTFGDGINRVFSVILSLCNSRNGILLIDEIENGLHYAVQADIWRTIFQLAKNLNVQVFATTHSWDCVRAFQEAASNSPEDGVLIRLTQRDKQIIPTLFVEKELEIATRDQIEVR
jgi:ABC-type lipoprotein export system ATPase subunit